MRGVGSIVACDRNRDKLDKIDSGANRLGIDIIRTYERDSSIRRGEAGGDLDGEFDVVFADVPCSGFGVIRKKPDIRYKERREVEGLPEIQKAILQGTSTFVKPGGVLLYSTCTVLRQENEGVIEWFLKENSAFSTEGFALPGIGGVPGGSITLWPNINGTDGFFICKLRRRH
jgi:16S rRNA (cytosine967-C5)-methyltransferase